MTAPAPTWYDVLGVGRDATPAEIKAAWRSAVDHAEPGTPRFRSLNEAADTLLDPVRREAYDATLPAVVVPLVTRPEPADVDLDPRTDPEADPEVEAEPAATADTKARRAIRMPRVNGWILACAAVVTVAALVVSALLVRDIDDRVAAHRAGPEASAAAERALTAVLSYDYRQLEEDRARAVRYLTPSYAEQYKKNFDKLITEGPDGSPGPAVKTKAVVTADVLSSGVVDGTGSRVRVLVFVNQSSVKGDASPAIFQNRVVATMVERGDSWLLSDLRSY